MTKKIFSHFFLYFVAVFLVSAQTIPKESKLTVAPPLAQNLKEDEKWIPLFAQGQLSADLQNYSGYMVIDRTAASALATEQERMEIFAEASNDSVSIEYAQLLAADYSVIMNILGKGEQYSLDCKIINVKTSQSVGKVYSNANVSRQSLNTGTAIHAASYELLQGIGISENQLSELKQKMQESNYSVQSAEILAQTSVAKGIVAERNGANIEALTYYIQARKNNKNLDEATKRMENMSAAVSGGNFGAQAKNLIKLRNDWDKLLTEAAQMLAENAPEFRLMYFTNVRAAELTEADYENNTMSLIVGAPYLKQTDNGGENEQLILKLQTAMSHIPESKNWGEKINNFPYSYGAYFSSDNWFYKASSYREKTPDNRYGNSKLHFERGGWIDYGKESDKETDRFDFTLSIFNSDKKKIAERNFYFEVSYRLSGSCRVMSSENKKPKGQLKYNLSDIVLSDIPVLDADSEKFYITVTQTGGRSVSIIPVPEDVKSYGELVDIVQSGSSIHNRILRIGGYIYESNPRGYGSVGTDISRLYPLINVAKVIDFSETNLAEIPRETFGFWARHYAGFVLPESRDTELILPNTLQVIGWNAFGSVEYPVSGPIDYCFYTRIKFTGTENQWNRISGTKYLHTLQDITFNYESDLCSENNKHESKK